MATSAQLSVASRDTDLRERLAALAAARGIANPQAWVDVNMRRLVSVDVGNNSSIATVYEYAVTQTKMPPRPGENPDYVRDDLLYTAIDKVNS